MTLETIPIPSEEELESVEGDTAITWARLHNKATMECLQTDPRFSSIEQAALKAYEDKDKIPYSSLSNGDLFNFWQDENHIRGILRRTTLEEYKKDKPNWELLLDLDALAEKEGKNWVYKGRTPLPPENRHCLVYLSEGGKDVVTIREFDFDRETEESVVDGFNLSEARSYMYWIDRDHVLVSTDFGAGSLTDAGYPKSVKLWTRGELLDEAIMIYEGEASDVSVTGHSYITPEGKFHLITRNKNFYSREVRLLPDTVLSEYLKSTGAFALPSLDESVKLKPRKLSEFLFKLPIPDDICSIKIFKKQVIMTLRTDWKVNKLYFPTGALISLDISDISTLTTASFKFISDEDVELKGEITHGNADVLKERHIILKKPDLNLKLIMAPKERMSIDGASATRSHLLVSTTENVCDYVYKTQYIDGAWQEAKRLNIDQHDESFPSWRVRSTNAYSEQSLIGYGDYLTPDTLYLIDGESQDPQVLKHAPRRFDSSELTVSQREVASKDGTMIPYFVIHPKKMDLNGTNPTLLHGYGGFEDSLSPSYLGIKGKIWLEEGKGVYVEANIRGGGEFGPKWHQAALREKRQTAFDDFEFVARDLIVSKITSPGYLGIQGASNGGLLVAVAATQHPELYKAVLCQAPLLNMLRYHKLLVGAIWMREYGDPEDPKMREAIKAYSPYQNVQPEVSYPEMLFFTSTKDDRVHPYHARAMVARMQKQGHPVLYYEVIEGGHGAAANLKQHAFKLAIGMTYLKQKLCGEVLDLSAEAKQAEESQTSLSQVGHGPFFAEPHSLEAKDMRRETHEQKQQGHQSLTSESLAGTLLARAPEAEEVLEETLTNEAMSVSLTRGQ